MSVVVVVPVPAKTTTFKRSLFCRRPKKPNTDDIYEGQGLLRLRDPRTLALVETFSRQLREFCKVFHGNNFVSLSPQFVKARG